MAMDEERSHPLFCTPVPGRAYTGRVGAYGVARSAHGLIAAVEDVGGRFYFPGGGVLPGESAASTLEREAQEECGWMVAVGELLTRAFQLIDTEREGSFLLDARYFPAIDPVNRPPTPRAQGRVASGQDLRRADASRL